MDDDVEVPPNGVDEPNFTQVPHFLIRYLMPKTTGAEFKVLMYMADQTWGYHRHDIFVPMSLRSISEATGVSKPSIVKILDDCIARGLVERHKRRTSEHGDEANEYRLRINRANSDASKASLHGGSHADLPARVNSGNTSSSLYKEREKERPTSRGKKPDRDDLDYFTRGKYGHLVE